MSVQTVILFIGPPGSGKGTLSQMCVQKLGWEQISTGNLCRTHIENKTEIGKSIDFAIKSGKLVSDSLMSQMVFEWFRKRENGSNIVILDGYPRTLNQAKDFADLTSHLDEAAKVVVVKFVVNDQVVIDRLSNRYICKNKACQRVYSLKSLSPFAPKKHMICDMCDTELMKRKDDHLEAICERLKVYHLHENDLLEHYSDTGYDIQEFESDLPLDQLFARLKKAIGIAQ